MSERIEDLFIPLPARVLFPALISVLDELSEESCLGTCSGQKKTGFLTTQVNLKYIKQVGIVGSDGLEIADSFSSEKILCLVISW